MDKILVNMEALRLAHNIPSNTSIRVMVGPDANQKSYILSGTPQRIVEIGVPFVELLTSDSKPDQQRLAEDAEFRFLEAANQLVTEDIIFYTHLRVNWALPAFRWRLARVC